MATLAEALATARQHHRAGRLRLAEDLYRQLLGQTPNDPELLGLLAEVCQGQGKLSEAAAVYQQALRFAPQAAAAHYGLANILREQGRREEAAAHYQEALRLDPDHAEAHTSFGILLAEVGRSGEAIAHWQAALRSRPDFAKAHHNLGVALAQQGKRDEAAASLRRALELQPGYAEAYCNLGLVLWQQGNRDEALACYRKALRLRPDYPQAYNNLGVALTELGKAREAVVLLAQAVRLWPKGLELHKNLGQANARLGRLAAAEACYQEALRLNPGYVDAHIHLATAWAEQGRMEEALAGYELALLLDPDSAGAHWDRALAWLAVGDFERGWREYEWRWRRKESPPRPFREPAWDGSPLAGRTILIYTEQGLGDIFQFIRYAAPVKRQGGTVLVQCPAFLVPLLSRCPGIDRLVAEGSELPPFDVQAPLLSLPRLLGTTLATIPAEVPYLTADPELVKHWRSELAGLEGFRVGIAWQGNPQHPRDAFRSFPLTSFAPLGEVPGVRLVSLQKGAGVEQLRDTARKFPVTELPSEQDASVRAFTDTAAIMQCLDLVITPDTSLAHLAGALAVPVWVPLPAVPDWRWLREREDSPWYPTLRLFRQTQLGDWGPVFQRMARELEQRPAPQAVR